MTKIKDKRLAKEIDPVTALASVYSLMQHHMGVNQDKVALLSLRERIEMSGQPALSFREEQHSGTVSNLLINTEEQEKKRIARELHDGIGQLLTSINLHVQQCLNASDSEADIPPAMKDSLQAISSMTKQAMGEMRGICSALRPAILDDLGVLAAINWQCRQISQGDSRLSVVTDYDVHESMIPDSYKTAIYRIVQEALNNAVKYARAESLTVKLTNTGEFLQLIIQDDGLGFDQAQASKGMGLISMRERAESIGGVFEMQSAQGQGVEIRVLLPIEKVALSG